MRREVIKPRLEQHILPSGNTPENLSLIPEGRKILLRESCGKNGRGMESSWCF